MTSPWADPDDFSGETTALRDRMTDDSRDGSDVIRKGDVGQMIEGGNLLNSPATRDRNPGGTPDSPLGPFGR